MTLNLQKNYKIALERGYFLKLEKNEVSLLIGYHQHFLWLRLLEIDLNQNYAIIILKDINVQTILGIQAT
jgi:hypothetical protein